MWVGPSYHISLKYRQHLWLPLSQWDAQWCAHTIPETQNTVEWWVWAAKPSAHFLSRADTQ